jgi:TolA-binding protein
MNTEPNQPEPLEADLAAAQERIRELEQELEAASDIIDEQEIAIECQRIQLEAAELTIDEATATRRKLEQRIADLEDELADEPCHVPVPKEVVPPQKPGYPPGYTSKPKVEAMVAQFRPRERK